MIIYKAVNKINNKIYVGKTIRSLKDRKKDHHKKSEWKRNSNSVLYKAIRKYGKENFEWSIVEECDSIEELSEREKYYIKKLKSLISQNGYNMTTGGEGGDIISLHPNKEEISNKKRKSMKGKNAGDKNAAKRPDIRKKISNTIKKIQEGGIKSPSNRIWKITYPNGDIFITVYLRGFCEDRNGWKYENLISAKNRNRNYKKCKIEEVII